MKITNIVNNLEMEHTYDIEVPDVHEYILSNGCVSHNTNSLIIGSTEGTEPISKLISEKTGTYSTKQLAPGLLQYGSNYQLSKDIPTKVLYNLAAIRQKYLDQGQSINTYAKDASSSYEVINDIIYAESIGLKSLYYLQSNTAIEDCESCGA